MSMPQFNPKYAPEIQIKITLSRDASKVSGSRIRMHAFFVLKFAYINLVGLSSIERRQPWGYLKLRLLF